jgi:hypothetical protein
MVREPRGGTKTFTWEVMPEIFWDAELALGENWTTRPVDRRVKENIMHHVATATEFNSVAEAMVKRLDQPTQIAINTLIMFGARRLYTPGITIWKEKRKTQ